VTLFVQQVVALWPCRSGEGLEEAWLKESETVRLGPSRGGKIVLVRQVLVTSLPGGVKWPV
jgi:hypothetical protein